MTKLYASALALLAVALVPFAGMAQKYNLVSMVSGLGESDYEYEYDRQGRLVSTYFQEEFEDPRTFLYYYDENSNLIRIEWYQEMPNFLGESKECFTAKIEYAYNDKNQLISRSTYNNFDHSENGPNFDYNSLIEYEYDALGRMSKSTVYFMDEGKELNNEELYYYIGDTEKLDSIVSREFLEDFKIFVRDSKVEFAYDKEGRLYQKGCTSYDPENGQESDYYGLVYTYDNLGNLESHYRVNSSGVKVWQFSFEYNNDIAASDCNFPVNLDDPDISELFGMMIHQPEAEVCYLQSASGALVRYDVIDFTYEGGDKESINAVVGNMPHALMVMGCKDGKLALSGVANGETLRIIDLKGRTVATPTYFGSADLSALPAGTYFVKGANGAGKFIR